MGWFNWKKTDTSLKNNLLEVDLNGSSFYYHLNQMLSGNKFDRFDSRQSLLFATNLAEVFTPLDAIADRVSSVDYLIYNKNTDKLIENIPFDLQRLLDKPNPMHSFSELVYQIMFSELASGGSYVLTKMPSSAKTKVYDRITNIWCLNPDMTYPKVKKEFSDPFMMKDLSEMIDKYCTHFMVDMKLEPSEVTFNTITRLDDNLHPVSPLLPVSRNINNLLAVYSARFNVYEKNGKAGIVFKDNKGGTDIQEQVNPVTRQAILDDIQNRDGITGDRNFTGVSAFPLGFIDTLGKIKDLEPFKETYANTIAIGAAFGVDKELLPKEGSTTFSNQKDVEKHFWQNIIKPYAEDLAKNLTTIFYLPSDWEFRPSFENVEILQSDRLTQAQVESAELANDKIKVELGIEINKDKWKE